MITPILLAGGTGTRLWPLSRGGFPKQFAPLTGGESLFQGAAKRLTGADFARPIVVTGEAWRFVVTEQLGAAGVLAGSVLIEPDGRNTAPATLAAVLWQAARDPEALMLVAPADHVLPDSAAFAACVAAGVPAARDGQIVTFGIRPDRAETGFGWLEPHETPSATRAVALARFVEKPAAAAALAMLEGGRHLWNAGIFLATARTFAEAFEAHAPVMKAQVARAVDAAEADLGFHRLGVRAWADIKAQSLDRAVMEKAGNLSVVAYGGHWSDLGGWEAIWHESARDADGVATAGPVTAIDCRDCLLRAEDGGQVLVGLGVENIVAVAMPDAVLVADRSRAQELRRVVQALEAAGAAQATEFAHDHRPWGWFETLAMGEGFRVKRIVVNPGGRLSLQSHAHRAEHWVVVAGVARITLGGRAETLTANQSVYVPLGAPHRLENPGDAPLVLIEVQTGDYLGEDDITRLEDAYRRG